LAQEFVISSKRYSLRKNPITATGSWVTTVKLKKRNKRRLIRTSLIFGNIALLIGVGFFILTNNSASQTVRRNSVSTAIQTVSQATDNPLDQLSSAEIASQVALMAGLPEGLAVKNQADSEIALLTLAPNDSTIVTKPQIVSTAQKSKKDIKTYKTQTGDTISSIATKFGISSDSVRWSNGLSGDSVVANKDLVIPPANGVAYKVKTGDTPASISARYKISKELFVLVNDAESGSLNANDYVWLPGGVQPAPVSYRTYTSYGADFAWGTAAIYGRNGYDYGWCTWYVANRVSMPANWGNANTWDNYAYRTPGWIVSDKPKVGAIAQTDAGGLGHVGYVESVSEDGSMIIYSDMNGLAGWGRVGRSGWVPATSKYQRFIYR
jgi:surface antigen/LysM repeat protein